MRKNYQENRVNRLKNRRIEGALTMLAPQEISINYSKLRKQDVPGEGNYKYWAVNSDDKRILRKMPGAYADALLVPKKYHEGDQEGAIVISRKVFENPPVKQQRIKVPEDQSGKKALLSPKLNQDLAMEDFCNAKVLNILFGRKKVPPIVMTLSDYNLEKYPQKKDDKGQSHLKYAPGMHDILQVAHAGDSGVKVDSQTLIGDIIVNALIGNLDTHNGNYFVKKDDADLLWVDISDPNKRTNDGLLYLFFPRSSFYYEAKDLAGKTINVIKYAQGVGVQNYDEINGFIKVRDFLRIAEAIESDGRVDKAIKTALIYQRDEYAKILNSRLEEMQKLKKFLQDRIGNGVIKDDTPMMQVALSIMERGENGDYFSAQEPLNDLNPPDGSVEHDMVRVAKEMKPIAGLRDNFQQYFAVQAEGEEDIPNPYGASYDEEVELFLTDIYKESAEKIEKIKAEINLSHRNAVTKANEISKTNLDDVIIGHITGKILKVGTCQYFLALQPKANTEATAGAAAAAAEAHPQEPDEVYNVFEFDERTQECKVILDYGQFVREAEVVIAQENEARLLEQQAEKERLLREIAQREQLRRQEEGVLALALQQQQQQQQREQEKREREQQEQQRLELEVRQREEAARKEELRIMMAGVQQNPSASKKDRSGSDDDESVEEIFPSQPALPRNSVPVNQPNQQPLLSTPPTQSQQPLAPQHIANSKFTLIEEMAPIKTAYQKYKIKLPTYVTKENLGEEIKLYSPNNAPLSKGKFDFAVSNKTMQDELEKADEGYQFYVKKIGEFVNKANEKSQFVNHLDIAKIIILAIKHQGIGNISEGKLEADFEKLGIKTDQYVEHRRKANIFSREFQKIAESEAMFTGNQKLKRFVGMRLKRININDLDDILAQACSIDKAAAMGYIEQTLGKLGITREELAKPGPDPKHPTSQAVNLHQRTNESTA